MRAPQLRLPLEKKLIVDLFAGGGGASLGIEMATGRSPDIAINHDADAVGMHEINHPLTRHYCKDIWEIDPLEVTDGRPVGLLHASPDCTHHSQALGGQPRDEEIRATGWVVLRWVGQTNPDIIILENVGQMLQWSPLIAKRCKVTGRAITLDKTIDPVTGKKGYRVAEPGERVPRERQFLVPDPRYKGRNWEHFVGALRAMGYVVQWRIICNADLSAHSTRTRLYVIARRDGLPIVWPEQTHAKKPRGNLKKWRPVSECIDWSIPGRSIFNRSKPLADATMRRIAHGMRKFVLDCPEPFIVPATHTDASDRNRSVSEPAPTVTGANRGELMQMGHGEGKDGSARWSYGANSIDAPVGSITASGGGQGIATAYLVQTGYGEREGQAPRALDIQAPLGTVVAGAVKHAATAAFMVQANAGFNTTHARDVEEPASTVTTFGSQQQLITAHLTTLRRNCIGRGMQEPVATLTAGAEHHALVEYQLSKENEEGALRCAAFLMRYHGEGGQWTGLHDPATTITTKDRLALVTVWFKGEPYVVVDICLRMLVPRELYNAQDFVPDYIIDRTAAGKALTKTAQVKMCGNSVCPVVEEALVAANYPPVELELEAVA